MRTPRRLAVLIVVLLTAGCGGDGRGVAGSPSSSSPPTAGSPSPTARSPAPVATPGETLLALRNGSVVSFVELSGNLVAQADLSIAGLSDIGMSAGGGRVQFVSDSHLWQLTPDGSMRDLGPLDVDGHAGLKTFVHTFSGSPSGTQWAWTSLAVDYAHQWPGAAGAPTQYSDAYVGGSDMVGSRVFQEISSTELMLYRWTARGPLAYRRVYADLPRPFPPLAAAPSPPLLFDLEKGSMAPVSAPPCGFPLDVAADGTVACVNGTSATFVRATGTTSVDLGGARSPYGADVQIQPGSAAGNAVVSLGYSARDESGNVPAGGPWRYETWIVDTTTGAVKGGPIHDVRPAWQAWLADGSLVLEGTSAAGGVFLYTANGKLQTVVTGPARVVGAVSGGA